MRPETRFARSGDVYLAYQVLGTGDRELVVALGGMTHLEAFWDVPEFAGYLEQLATFGRVLIFDKRGSGLSDRVVSPGVETSADDIVAVMDAAGFDRAVLLGALDAASVSLVAAARHPDRVSAVVGMEAVPSFVPDAEDPAGFPPQIAETMRTAVREAWGHGHILSMFAGRVADDPRVLGAWQRLERMAATPTTAAAWLEHLLTIDVRPYLEQVRVPVLLLHARHNPYTDAARVRWLAEHLPEARVVELDGDIFDVMLAGGSVLDEIEQYVAGTRLSGTANREFAAVLVTDLVGSTRTLARVGEQGWQHLLTDHRRVVRAALRRYDGTEIDTAGDGFLATFRLASHALQCAADISAASSAAGVGVRQGVHAGEVAVFDGGIAGRVVHAAARVAALAGAGEVFLTETALAVAAGAHPPVAPVGTRTLRGLDERVRVHRLVDRPPETSVVGPPPDESLH